MGNRKLDSLVFNKTFDLKEASGLLSQYKREIVIWDSGACSRYCRTQLEYEKGFSMPTPNYAAIQKMLKLALLKGRTETATGRSSQGALTYSKAIKTAMDFSGGSELPIGRMVGIVAGKSVNRVIAVDIDRCDTRATWLLQSAMEKAEKSWPDTRPTLEMQTLSLYLAFDNKNAIPFLRQSFILCWKHYFSVKRSLIYASEVQQKILDETKVYEDKYWINIKPILEANKNRIQEATRGDFLASLSSNPSFTNLFIPEYELRIGFRLLKDALILREYRLENGKYPNSLTLVLNDSLQHNDIATGRPLQYKFKNNKIRLYSLGLNLKDDDGEGLSLAENLVRHRDEEINDDLWIELK